MKTHQRLCNRDGQDLNSNACWGELYPELQSLARRFVFSSAVPLWRGQEHDIVDDIVQETALRLLEYQQKVIRGEATPIRSLKSLVAIVAQNKCRDSARQDRRFVRITSEGIHSIVLLAQHDQASPLEVAINNVDREICFSFIARLIAHFPEKQRYVLLIDLANRMSFDAEPTSLQRAFLEVGIRLQDYQKPLSADPVERTRHSALLSQAYKRFERLCHFEYDE